MSDVTEPDEAFAGSYEGQWRRALFRLGGDTLPVVIRLGDDLHWLYRGERSCRTVVGAEYHALKRLAHWPAIALLSVLDRTGSAASAPPDGALDALVPEAYERVHHAIATLRAVTAAFLERAERPVSLPTVREFADAVYAPVNCLIEQAARWEVASLHEEVGRLEAQCEPEHWARAYFCVVGDVEPRYKELSKQYLQRYLQRHASVRGGYQHQLLYAEGDHDIDSVLVLLAKREVNRLLGEVFTGSALGLEQDLLGVAAERAIDEIFRA